MNGNSCVLCQLVMISLQSQGSRSRHWQTGQPKCQGHLIPPEALPSVTIGKFSVGSNNNCFEEKIKRRQIWKKNRLPLKSGLPRSLVAIGRPAAACRPAPQCRLQSPRGLPQNFNLGPAFSCSFLLYLKLYFVGLSHIPICAQMSKWFGSFSPSDASRKTQIQPPLHLFLGESSKKLDISQSAPLALNISKYENSGPTKGTLQNYLADFIR